MAIELLLGETPPEEVRAFLRQAKIQFDREGVPSFPLERPEITRALEAMAAIIAHRVIRQEKSLGTNVPKLGCVIGGDVLPTHETPMEGFAYALSAMVATRLALADCWAPTTEDMKSVGRIRVGFIPEKKKVSRSRQTPKATTINTVSLAPRWRMIGDIPSLRTVRCLVIVDELDVDDHGEMAARIIKGVMSKKIQGDNFDHRKGPSLIANLVALSVIHAPKAIEQLFRERLEHHDPQEEDEESSYVPRILTFLNLERPAPKISKSHGDIPAFSM